MEHGLGIFRSRIRSVGEWHEDSYVPTPKGSEVPIWGIPTQTIIASPTIETLLSTKTVLGTLWDFLRFHVHSRQSSAGPSYLDSNTAEIRVIPQVTEEK